MRNPALEYNRLRRLYMSGMSYRDIGKLLDVEHSSVAKKLKVETLRRGGTWPLRSRNDQRSRHDTVVRCGTAQYVRDLHVKHGVSYAEFAVVANTSVQMVWNLVAPGLQDQPIERERAHRMMRAVEHFEKKLGVRL